MPTDPQRKAAIARLVAQGKMTHENPGQYIPDDVDDESKAAIPKYDVDVIRTAMPDILQMDFDEQEDGCFVVLEDGRTGESTKITLGFNPPPTTGDLIAAIQAHFRGLIDMDELDETAAALAVFDEEAD